MGTSLVSVYEEAGQKLLLLGEPGAGKSTLFLELACELVELAEQDQSQWLPVIVPLSSRANKQQPMEWWLAE
jgi:predicted NACHT family NTPase